jgi:linearmycin/streptolysin S transport system permease protein
MSGSKLLAITGQSLLRIVRDRTSLFFTVFFPFVIILGIGLAIGGFSDRESPVGIVNPAKTPLAAELGRRLERSPAVMLRAYTDAEQLRRDIRRGVVVAGVVVPPDYDEQVRRGKGADVGFLADISRGFPAAIRTTVSAVVAEQGARLQAARFATEHVGGGFDRNLTQARRVAEIVPQVAVRAETVGRRSRQTVDVPSGFEYTAPANLVLFVFITSLAAAAGLIESRRLGVTRRMLATPTTARTILGGFVLSRFAIAALQSIYIIVLGSLVFGVDFGNPVAAAVLALLFALVATAFAMLVGTWSRTPEQAGSIGPPVGIAMGMLSGCMWPRFIMPPFMQKLGQLFPQSWAMDAWIKLIAQGAGLRQIAPQLGVLAVFVVVLLPIATWRMRRSIVSA